MNVLMQLCLEAVVHVYDLGIALYSWRGQLFNAGPVIQFLTNYNAEL